MKYKKRPDGRYCKQILVGYKDNGSRIMKTIYGKTIKEIEQKEIDVRNNINTGKNFAKENITFGDWRKTWLNTYKRTVSRNTFSMYENSVYKHIIPSIGNINLSKLKPSHIQKAINNILDSGNTRTAQIYKMTVKQIIKQAVLEGYITKNVCDNLQAIKNTHNEKRTLTDFELKCIENTAYTDRERLFLDIMYYTGLRKGEVLALSVSDIDTAKHTINVSHSLDISKNTPLLKEPKSKAGYREIPVPDVLYIELMSYIKNRKSIRLFTTQDGALITRSAFRRMWESIIKKTTATADRINLSNTGNVNVKSKISFTPHIFRHTYATNLYYAGIDIKSAQYLLGHSSLDMTLRIYTHLDSERSNNMAREKIKNFFSQSKVSQM